LQLVFFDLDGTISRRDTLVPFLAGFLARRPWRLPRLLLALPAVIQFISRRDRGALKGALIHAVMGGVKRADVAAWTADFVPRLIERGLFADALRAIEAHRCAEDHLVLMSASVDLYVPDIGKALGFSETLCSRVRWNQDRLDGRLSGANCRDIEKARLFREIRLRFPDDRTIAYGNSTPDLPHLDLADQGWMINATGRLLAECERRKIGVLEWS
jgi:phosphatidylglycerophosphatase C